MFSRKSLLLSAFCVVAFVPILGKAQSVDVQLSTSTTNPQMKQPFDIVLEIKKVSDTSSIVSKGVNVPGIENFAQIGTSNSTSMQRINGKTAVLSTLKKTVLPSEPGVFTLGPVKVPIKDEKGVQSFVESDAVTVTVSSADGSSAAPPETLGDNSGFFEENPQKPDTSVSLFPEGNWMFWVQVGGILIGLWGVWLILNKKLIQKSTERHQFLRASQAPPSQIEAETVSNPVQSSEPQWDIEFPSPADPEFLQKIQQVIAVFCTDKFCLTVSKITKRDILPKAEEYFSRESLEKFKDLLETYEKARFAKFPIDKKVFVERLELFLRKHY